MSPILPLILFCHRKNLRFKLYTFCLNSNLILQLNPHIVKKFKTEIKNKAIVLKKTIAHYLIIFTDIDKIDRVSYNTKIMCRVYIFEVAPANPIRDIVL